LSAIAMTELRRAVVINDDATGRGGASAIAVAMAQQLRARGIAVTFLAGEGAPSAELTAAGIETVILGGRHILDGRRGPAAVRGLYDGTTGGALRRWLLAHDERGTVYHLHNWHKVLSPAIFAPLRLVAFRLVLSAHDYFLACPNGGYFLYPRRMECELPPGGARCLVTSCDRRHYGHKLWRVARHAVRRRLLHLGPAAALVLAVHEKLAAHLARGGIPAESIRVLRNPVLPWRQERVTAERNRDVFFVGRVDADKGADRLARAARRAGVHLRIIGDGPLQAEIARDHPDVELLGWQSRERIAALIATARMLVIPTTCRETFGLAPLEALTSGIPVVVSRFALIADEVARHRFGLACDPYDEPALAAQICSLADDDARVRDISERAFAGARALAPTPAEWCERLLMLYEERLCAAAEFAPPAAAVSGATFRRSDIAGFVGLG
jgi:glycosyltransferase involved in cell wall biosynthesis